MLKNIVGLILLGSALMSCSPPEKQDTMYLCEKYDGSVKFRFWFPDVETVRYKEWDIGIASKHSGISFRDLETGEMKLYTETMQEEGIKCTVVQTRKHVEIDDE